MSAEINVRLIYDHNHILVVLQNIFDIRKILCNSGRSIWIREDHTAVCPVIIFFYNAKIFIKRLALIRNAKYICPYIVKRIGDIREEDRTFGIEKRQKTHGQHIIGSNADKNLIFIQMIKVSQFSHQQICGRIRIKTKFILFQFIKNRFHFGRRGVWVLICIQFHYLLPRLFSRNIRIHYTYII